MFLTHISMNADTESLKNQNDEKDGDMFEKMMPKQVVHFFESIKNIVKKTIQTHKERTELKEMEVLYKKLVVKAMDHFLLTHEGPDGSYPIET